MAGTSTQAMDMLRRLNPITASPSSAIETAALLDSFGYSLTPILEQRIGPYRLPMVISKRSRRPSHHGTWISGRSAERRTGL